MRNIGFLTALIMAFFSFSITAEAQKKKPVRKTTTKASAAAANDVRNAKEKVSNQISNVSRFIEVLGPIATSIENLDKEAKTKKVSRTSLDQNEANKRKVIRAVRNLRAGLVALEVDFRTKNALKKFLVHIKGISDLSAQSEDAALAGRFTESGKPLSLVVGKLTDTLTAMP